MASDDWYFVKEDGRIMYHWENDGAAFLRKGPEATDREVSFKEAAGQESSSPNKFRDLMAGIDTWEKENSKRHPFKDFLIAKAARDFSNKVRDLSV